jgi:hypothetical protein
LSTVLGEDEMVQADPTDNSGPPGANRLVHIRDQPIRDILDRVAIFRDLEPVQVSTILTNLALYVERVHSKCHDPRLLPDMAHFLIKVTKYTAEWDQQQQQRHKEQSAHLRAAQEQPSLQHHYLKNNINQRGSQQLLSGNTSTMVSDESSIRLQLLQQQKQAVMSVNSGGSTLATPTDHTSAAITPPPLLPDGHPLVPGRPMGIQRTNTTTSVTLAPTITNMSALSSQEYQEAVRHATQQSTKGSAGSTTPIPPAILGQPSPPQKPATLKHGGIERESNPYVEYQSRQSTLSHTLGRHRHAANNQLPLAQKQVPSHHWDYINPILGMCSILMIQSPFEGHQLITAVKHILRQALYRDRISAPALIRIVTGYCFIAEQDFSLSLVNVFGEFVVQELKNSIQSYSNIRYDDGFAVRKDEMNDISDQEDLGHRRHHHHANSNRHRRSDWNGKRGDRDEKKGLSGAGPSGEGPLHLSRGYVGTGIGGGIGGVGGGLHNASGRTKILAHNFHVLHHVCCLDHFAASFMCVFVRKTD